MGIVIDFSVLVAAERGQLEVAGLVAGHGDRKGFISAITASEMLHGLHRATRPEHRSRREVFLEYILSRFPVLPFDLIAARLHARLGAELAAKGIAVGAHDLLIGATALAHGSQLATRDDRSFPHIPGLSILRW